MCDRGIHEVSRTPEPWETVTCLNCGAILTRGKPPFFMRDER